MISRFLLFIGAVLVAFLAGCTKPPRLNHDSVSSALEPFSEIRYDLDKFVGSGDLIVSQKGRRNSGKADVLWDSADVLKAHIYSPFGAQVASIEADGSRGRILMSDDLYLFALDEKMETLPFRWGSYFTFRQFIRFLTGRMPLSAGELEKKPDDLTHDNADAVAVWQSDSLMIRAQVGRRSGNVQTIRFQYNNKGSKFSVRFSNFEQGLAREITIRDDSRNYISIKYDDVTAQ
ncbi:MAG: hypothetical protein ACLFVQ_02045 [Chitinispirillaceae bacterium]